MSDRREYFAQRYRDNKEHTRQLLNRWRRDHPDWQKRSRARHPARSRAHSAVNNAVRRGKLTKPECCESCGAKTGLQAHHEDYSHPLEVTWLCASCHARIHTEARHAG